MEAKAGIMIHTISSQEVKDAFRESRRQYFVGNLKKAQKLNHVSHKQVEIGLTRMSAGQKERPHYHKLQWEFVYMLKGVFLCVDECTGQQYRFEEGDFFAIESRTCYTQEALTDCLLYFVKCPAVDDKIQV